MDPATISLLLKLIDTAVALAPTVERLIANERARSGQTAEEIFAAAEVKLTENELKLLGDLHQAAEVIHVIGPPAPPDSVAPSE